MNPVLFNLPKMAQFLFIDSKGRNQVPLIQISNNILMIDLIAPT